MDWQLTSQVLLPEIVLLVGIVLTLLTSLFNATKKYNAGLSAIFFLLASLICLKNFNVAEPQLILFNSFVSDSLSVFMRMLIYAVSFLIVMGAKQYLQVLESPAEYYPIIMTASLGAGLLTGVNDFLFLFVALETLGLSAILLASYARLNQGSNEAGIKYLITSAVATSILLLGVSFLYGLTGATNFINISARVSQLNSFTAISAPLFTLITVALVATIAFKLAAAPFHNWSPDVYSGAPTTTTLFLSVVSKVAAFALAIRLFITVLNSPLVMALFGIVAILSIIVGNYVGLIQIISRGSVKRLLAYSSIAQAGYLLIGLAVFQKESVAALILYLTIYALMNTGAFLCVIYFEHLTGSDKIYDFAGAIQKRPVMAIAFALCLINLAGLPFIPAGFIAKFFLFSAAFASGTGFGMLLAIVGLIGSIIALFYYLYLVKIMVVDPVSTAVKYLPEKDNEGSALIRFSTGFAVVSMAIFGIFGMDVLQKTANYVINNMLN